MEPETSPAARRAALAVLVLALAGPARAYRPFVSTDAAVAAPRTLELELGYFGLARTAGEDGYSSPQSVINFGLRDRFEAVGEFVVQHPHGARSQVVDAALNLKGVLREGVLQGRAGPSAAAEGSLLLPDGDGADKRAGYEQTLVVSQRLASATLHWNLGGGWERSASLPFGSWGLIAEAPVWRGLRAAGELNGASVRGEVPDNSGLLGAVWETGWRELALDAGWRRGLSAAAAQWAVTAGFTIAFRP